MRWSDAPAFGLLAGCASAPVVDPGCPVDAPCVADLGDVAGVGMVVTSVFDRPLYEVWTGSSGDAPVVTRRVMAGPDSDVGPGDAVIDGAWPAVAWDAERGEYWLCRVVDASVGCATSADGQAWAEGPWVRSPDPAVRPLRPIAVLPGEPTELYLLAERDGTVGVYAARHDGGDTLHLETGPVAGSAATDVLTATAWEDDGTLRLVVVDGDGARELEADTAGAWSNVGELPEATGATWIAAATFYGDAIVWRSP